MLTPRKSHCSGVHSGYLYAAGGTDVQKPVTAAERIRLEGLNRETKVLERGFVVLFVAILLNTLLLNFHDDIYDMDKKILIAAFISLNVFLFLL